MDAYQPTEGNVLAEYKTTSGATAYIMDTFLRDVPAEELRIREEKAKTEARRLLERHLGTEYG
ncbi:MAG: hypothetical protein Q4P20_05890 [Eubacteriales bacterium]|nr:hypothetical protein [Eubacteriales bacterium]